jgi:exodeoxyribonuclease-1
MPLTLYWHDYETFGVDPRRDRPAQFAGVRTDEDLNELGDPLVIYCKPSRDMLPHPEACLLTGITPQLAEAQGVLEPEFIACIHSDLAKPGTCGVGYNTLRFDDEVTRHTLYRNFYDPYAREWQDGNSRWDLIDLVRMTYALRPEGIQWPRHDNGNPCFRLEDLSAANGIGHESAHDALSDVRATIDLARLLRDQQPKLFSWLFQLRNKHKAMAQLDLSGHTPVVHTSRMYPSETGCTTLVMPLVRDSGNNNAVLVYDLRHNPEPFMNLDVDSLYKRLFSRTVDLPEDVERLPVKSVKTNKCPALAPQSTLDEASARRIAIDVDACRRHWQQLRTNEGFMQRIALAYNKREFSPAGDVDIALYEGFLGEGDRQLLSKVREAAPQELARNKFDFTDKRLPELLFRYRARNWPETLSTEEAQQWELSRCNRLENENGGGSITLGSFYDEITRLRVESEGNTDAQQLLNAVETWGRGLT